jgi:hypothetical protein
MQSKAGNIGLVARTRHCPMHRPDDVSPNPEIARRNRVDLAMSELLPLFS